MDLEAELPRLLPLAAAWAEAQADFVARTGLPLNAEGRRLAARVGVTRPELVRTLTLERIPAPDQPLLRAACLQLDFLGPRTAGLTLGSSIFLRREAGQDLTVLAHELRHVAQYEAHPSIAAYLAVYVPELLRYGYDRAPLEVDARAAAAACF